jgi:predicted TIM-barrel fold metal-dependent hydrolase
MLRELPNLYACFCCPKAGDLPYLVEAAGADRVLFGSDFGAGGAGGNLLAERLDEVLLSELPDSVLQQILFDNAARLLHLDERPLPAAL